MFGVELHETSLVVLNAISQGNLNNIFPVRIYASDMSIGARIRQLREQNKLSGEQFGELCGVSKGMVSHWESDTNTPTIDRILQLRAKLDFSIEWLVAGEIDSYTTRMRPAIKNLLMVAEHLPDQAVHALTREGATIAELLDLNNTDPD